MEYILFQRRQVTMSAQLQYFPILLMLLVTVVPWIIGFTWVRSDANRFQQPGIIWAFLTIPLSWIAILAYVVVRAIIGSGRSSVN